MLTRVCVILGQEEGSAGLERWLAADKERSLPEYQRKRPKYYYYYEWMRQRIADHCGALPESVVDKLLNVEAGELDTLLIYPAGVQAKARSHATFTVIAYIVQRQSCKQNLPCLQRSRALCDF